MLTSVGITSANSEFYGLRQFLSAHPGFQPDACCPVLKAGYAPQVLPNMLLADISDRDIFSLAVTDRDAEDSFRQKDSLGIHAELKIMPSRSF